MSAAYLLIAHGSRDRRSQEAFAALARQLTTRLSVMMSQSVLVGTAYLELSSQPLHQQIVQFAHHAVAESTSTELHLLPLFLLPGMHVRDDIPVEVTQARTLLTIDCQLHLKNYLGAQAGFVPLLRRLLSRLPASQRILMAHGSRRFGGNAPIEAMAGRLQALPSYWAIAPTLSTQIKQLVSQGHQDIAIQPYFLFPGGITTAIADEVALLQQQFEETQLHLGYPLSEAPEFIALVLDWLLRGDGVGIE
ncbi:MAG: sirohydrochlorin chelatase [Spirulina sp. SIO3F2]|nr:sirohydrochlorin chelatase [Spirulina sp. SIO3F2]